MDCSDQSYRLVLRAALFIAPLQDGSKAVLILWMESWKCVTIRMEAIEQ